jgi:hypothetical protein
MPRSRKSLRRAAVPLGRRFRTALANAELTITQFAEANGWTRAHVIQVVDGKRESARVCEAVELFVVREEKAIAARAGAA